MKERQGLNLMRSGVAQLTTYRAQNQFKNAANHGIWRSAAPTYSKKMVVVLRLSIIAADNAIPGMFHNVKDKIV